MTLQSSMLSSRVSGFTYPNRFARYWMLALREMMGEHGLQATLELANLSRLADDLPPENMERAIDFAVISAINLALDEMYGGRGGRGMALRGGRAWLVMGMNRFGALNGVDTPEFRAQPVEARVRAALHALAAIFSRFSDQHSRLEENDSTFRFIVEESPMCWGQESDRAICHPLVGLLQETARWAGNGRDFAVREVQCKATGAQACVFVINKQPL